MSYKLKDEGFPYLKIYSGKKWIGRVYKNVQNQWVCQIGKQTYYAGRTAVEAFDEGTSRYMGYSSAAALRESNRKVQERNVASRQRVHELADRYVKSDFKGKLDVIDELMNVCFPKPKPSNQGEVK